jgi:hypothetical protein
MHFVIKLVLSLPSKLLLPMPNQRCLACCLFQVVAAKCKRNMFVEFITGSVWWIYGPLAFSYHDIALNFLHLPYKIELMNFGGRIVENTYTLLGAVVTLLVAKLNLPILCSAVSKWASEDRGCLCKMSIDQGAKNFWYFLLLYNFLYEGQEYRFKWELMWLYQALWERFSYIHAV